MVFVDDGSTDFSYEFAKMYERKHLDRMKTLRVPEKKMAGGCRNAGIDYPVECEYLYFLDSDDYLYSNDTLAKLHKDAVAAGMPDMLLGSFAFDYGGRVRAVPYRKFNAKSNMLASSGWNSSSSKIQRASIAEKFLEKCRRGEDTYQWLKTLDKNPSYAQVQYPIFAYRQHEASTSHSLAFVEDRSIFVNALKEMLSDVKNPWVAASIRRRCGI